jgi:hypothetical protein
MKIAVYICNFPAKTPIESIQSLEKHQILIKVSYQYYSELSESSKTRKV